ncbi:uncharacterized protein DUF4062 [Paraburkholderia unamae]|uniref:DUF4062 domain-containing protein n=1 Tax=Paraburkholderia unamae TaxID=219649 RepID=UPI000DC476DA|nr:DUF4062 domain-containing protein [Paraburkholderia unamae]RAR62490.1 uncharacterized protein DUF4062 [Paraburkholderia unamae]
MRADSPELWQLSTAEPEPPVDHDDLRLSPDSIEIDRDEHTALMLLRERHGESTWVLQQPDGRREPFTENEARFAIPSYTQQREIRVFLSSTFQDMQAERSYLVKVVFPRLKRLASSHGIVLSEIDLRWGVSLEEVERGETVAICLDEIDRCRACPPFFIGLLGERYGWTPEPAALDALDNAMASRAGGGASEGIRQRARSEALSVTEMEIRYGVLDTPQMQPHAFFYLRSPALSKQLASAVAGSAGHDAWFDEAHAARQHALKDALRERGLVRMDGYRSVVEMGDDIERAVSAAIVRLARQLSAVARFTQGPMPGGWEVNERLTEAIRAQTFYIVRNEPVLCAADAWADRENPGRVRVIVTGPAGSGKATAADYLTLCTRARWLAAPEITLHCRTGVAVNSDDAFYYLRTMMSALGLLPPWEGAARVGLVEALTAIERPVILTVTDIDLLDNWQDLIQMLGANGNPKVAVILTTSEADLNVPPAMFQVTALRELDPDERRGFVRDYLARFRKSLDAALLEHVVAMPLAGSPYFLQLLMDELRRGAVFETLDAAIDAYANLRTLDDAFERSLAGWVSDMASDATSLARWRVALEALAVAHHGVPNDFFVSEHGAALSPLQWWAWQGRAETALLDVGGASRLRDKTLRHSLLRYCFGAETDSAPALAAQAAARRRFAAWLGAGRGLDDVTGLLERMDQLLWLSAHDDNPDDLAALQATLAIPENAVALMAYGTGRLMAGCRQLLARNGSLTPLADAALAAKNVVCLEYVCRTYAELGKPKDTEALARRVLAEVEPADAATFEFFVSDGLFLQDRWDEVLAYIEPGLRKWAAAPGGTPPLALGVLASLVADGHAPLEPWIDAINAGVAAVLAMEPTQSPDFQVRMLSSVLPIVASQQNAELTWSLAMRALSLSYGMPNPGGPRMRCTVGPYAVDALRMLGRYDEAVAVGGSVLMTDVGDLPVLEHSRALCARCVGHTFVEMQRFGDAVELLEYALEAEPIDETDYVPKIVGTGLLAVCMFHLGEEARAQGYVDAFAAWYPHALGAGIAVKGMVKAHLEHLGRADAVNRLEAMCPAV